jgi:DNA-binding response OmpR family regulator
MQPTNEDDMGNLALRVLVVEDDLVDFLSVERALCEGSGRHYDLDWAATIEKGKRMLEDKEFDAILLDLGLPDALGVDSVIHMNANAPKTPIVVLSGEENQATAIGAVGAGAEDYLRKDMLSGRRLDERIRFAMERHRLRNRIIQNVANLQQPISEPLGQDAGKTKGASS